MTFVINFLKIATPMAARPGRKFSILYYFNDENVDLKERLQYLNTLAINCNLSRKGWKLPFCMQTSVTEGWNYDYVKRVEFVLFQ